MEKTRNIEDAWQAIRRRLEAERLRIQHEIIAYPPPIPACDACFNDLLEQRALVCDELARMQNAAAESATSSDPFAVLASFVASSRYVGNDG
jgi:hypothetical protein